MKINAGVEGTRIIESDGTTAGTFIHYGAEALGGPSIYNSNIYFFGDDTTSGTGITSGLYKLIPIAGGTLPVSLTEFSATLTSHKEVQLKWLTANEINSKGFYIERSDKSLQFSSLQFIPGQSNLSQGNSYSFLDTNPFDGVNYYRLKQVDNDGKFIYSPIRQISVERKNEVIISPNPVKGPLIIHHHLTGGKVILRITDMKGRVLTNGIYDAKENPIRYNASGLAAGIYLLNLEYEGRVISSDRFVKE